MGKCDLDPPWKDTCTYIDIYIIYIYYILDIFVHIYTTNNDQYLCIEKIKILGTNMVKTALSDDRMRPRVQMGWFGSTRNTRCDDGVGSAGGGEYDNNENNDHNNDQLDIIYIRLDLD